MAKEAPSTRPASGWPRRSERFVLAAVWNATKERGFTRSVSVIVK
jgi:hypothetical protein